MLYYCTSLYLSVFITYTGLSKSEPFDVQLGKTTIYTDATGAFATACNENKQCFTYNLECKLVTSALKQSPKPVKVDVISEYKIK